MARGRNIQYRSPRGRLWHLHGENMGAEGVYLTSFSSIWHPQRVPITATPAYKRGAIPGPPKTDASKFSQKVFTSAETSEQWERVESQWWEDWSDEEDGTLIVESITGTTRYQPVRLETYPDDPMEFEPDTEMDWTMKIVSYSPGWRGATMKSSATGTGLQTLKVANPGNVELWMEFTGDPVPGIRLPDGLSGRFVPLPDDMTAAEGSWHVMTDQTEVPAENTGNTQIVGRMAGMLFQNPLPPRTPLQTVPINLGPTNTTVRAYMTPIYDRPVG